MLVPALFEFDVATGPARPAGRSSAGRAGPGAPAVQ
jgi:hypothetical protein